MTLLSKFRLTPSHIELCWRKTPRTVINDFKFYMHVVLISSMFVEDPYIGCMNVICGMFSYEIVLSVT